MQNYLDLLRHVLEHGAEKADRTGTGTRSVFGWQLRYRLDDWWPPSGGGMWPGTFWNIDDGKRIAARCTPEAAGAAVIHINKQTPIR